MSSLLAVSLLLAGAVDVQVETLAGQTITGTLIGLNTETLTLATPGGDRALPVRSLLLVTPLIPPGRPKVRPPVWVELIDGSRLSARSFAVAGGMARITLPSGEALKVSTGMIQCALFKSHENLTELQTQWDQIKTSQVSGDTIVIRKQSQVKVEDDDRGTVKTVFALDTLEGVLRDITADVVQFDFDGDVIPVRRAKLEGVVYYHPPGPPLPDPRCRLSTSDGSDWYVKSLQIDGEWVRFRSVAGVDFSVPIRRITKLDFSTGNTVFLSDLTPAAVHWQPFFAAGTASDMLAQLYQPRMDRALDGGKLKLYSKRGFAAGKLSIHEKSFEKGIALHSRTVLEYLLSGKFKRLRATAGIDPRVRRRGNVHLRVQGDRKTLYEGDLRGDDPEPVELDLDVAGVRRLTILVDFGQETDIADHLNLCNARLTK